MQLTGEIFRKLVKYRKIQDCSLQVFDCDWFFKKLSKDPNKAWLQCEENGQIVERNVSDIERIACMAIERFMESVNIDKNGNLTYLEINEETDYNNDIKGKKEFSYKEIPFINDMSIVFNNDKDSSIRGRIFKVKGVGLEEGIQLKNIKGRPRTIKGE